MTLYFTQDHEWISGDFNSATVGITDYAQAQLGDVVFVSLPSVGDEVPAGAACGEVESTKSVSDIFSPVAGTITAVGFNTVAAQHIGSKMASFTITDLPGMANNGKGTLTASALPASTIRVHPTIF